MKRIVLCLIILVLTSSICMFYASAEEFNVFSGVKWGDDIDHVESVLGKGERSDFAKPIITLRYRKVKIGLREGDCILSFNEHGLYIIKILCIELDKDSDLLGAYVDAFSTAYGEVMMTNSDYLDYNGTIEEKADGEFYFWKADEKTGIFIRSGSSSAVEMYFTTVQNDLQTDK